MFVRFWTVIDISVITLNCLVCSTVFTGTEGGISTKTLRVCESFLILAMFIKSLYFMRLNQEIAPLVGIITQILDDIKYFMIIYVIMLIALMMAYYNIGKNQMLENK